MNTGAWRGCCSPLFPRSASAALPYVIFLFVCLWGLVWPPAPASAQMVRLADDELAAITGHGFSSFSVTQENGLDIARLNLDIRAATFTEIDSLKMGYYDRGAGSGWDQNWLATDLGENANHLNLSGFFMEARFTNLDDAGSRQLAGVTFGYQSVTGTISTNLQSFSGTIQGVAYDRENLGDTTITLNGEVVAFTLDVSEGIRFQIGDDPASTP
jgi:hypothetical protein